MTEPGSPEELQEHLARLYRDFKQPCRCEHAYKGLGRIDGLDMGKGWVRTTTHPYCWHHGDAAQAHFKKTGHRYEGRSPT